MNRITPLIRSVYARVQGEWDAVRPFPFIMQVNQTECGLACLGMVLTFHGRHVRLEELREVLAFNREGVTAGALLEAARRLGLRGRAVRLDLDGLDHLPRGALLHWGFNHFVVLDRVDGKGVVHINDPGTGPRAVNPKDLNECFTGVALILEPSEHFEKAALPNATLALLKRTFAHPELLRRIVVVSALAQLTSLMLPLVMGVVIDRVLPRRDFDFLEIVAVGAALLMGFYGVLVFVREQLVMILRVKFDVTLVVGLLEHMLNLPFSYFQIRDTGHLLHRFQSAAWIRDALSSGVASAVIDAAFAVTALVALFVTGPSFAVLALGLGAVQVTVLILLRRHLVRLWRRDLELAAKSTGVIVELIQSIETLKLAGAEGRGLHDWSQLYVRAANNLAQRGAAEGRLLATRQTFALLAPLTVLLWGTNAVLHGDLSIGAMLASNALAVAFLQPLAQATMFLMTLGAAGVHADRLDDIFSQDVEVEPNKISRAHHLQGGIDIEDVSFAYGEKGAKTVQNVSLSVEAGSFVAIVGASGSGKTTLGRILLGLLLPSSGTIKFDGIALSDLDLRSVRQQVGVVSQRTHLLARTVRDNVTLMDQAVPVADVESALASACVLDDVKRLALGIHTEVAEDGRTLSGGQRQRIALARALLRRPAILLLDEATSALDAETERRVQENLEKLQCTRVVIAHRLSTIQRADLIVVMEKGAIVEQGSHAALLAAGGTYARLVRAQLTDDRALD